MTCQFSGTFLGSRYFLNNVVDRMKNTISFRAGRDLKERGCDSREGPHDI